MTDDPRRRHLSPEEAAELRRRARERRGYVDPGSARSSGPAPDPRATGRGVREEAGYQPRQRPEPLSPEERARYLRGDPRDPRDRRPAGDALDPGAAARARRSRAGTRDPYRQPVDRRARPGGARPHPGRTTRGAGARAGRGIRDRRQTRRRIRPLRVVALVLVVILTLGVLAALWADSRLQRIDALPDYPGRVGNTPGTVTLLVGTDSREGLTPEQQALLSTGSESDAGGKRTDTMMLVYTPRGRGDTMLISLPRDLLVDIPGYGQNKLNAAYTFGGPPLLTQTLEQQTGVQIDHYAEIGFGGFAGIVDAVGGVDMCLDEPISDPLAGLELAAGCQTLNGPQSLGFVRTRYGFAEQDLQRVRNQRQFLGALMKQTLSPGNLLNPFTVVPLVNSAADAVTVDTGDHIWNLAAVMWRLSGDPLTVTAPHDGMASGTVGSYLVWGPSTSAFFEAVAAGRMPPPEYLEPAS